MVAGAAVVALAVGARSPEGAAPGPAAAQSRMVPVPREVAEAPTPILPEPTPMPKVLAVEAPPPASPPTKPERALEGNALADVADRLTGLLCRELALTEFQRVHVVAALRRREGRIQEYHRQILAAGVFSEGDYDHRTGRLMLDSYQAIASVLDSFQERVFSGMVAESRLGDGSAFEIPEGMVITQ